jgi:hypothetical protein
VDLTALEGKRIALVLTDELDESAAFTGIAHWDGHRLLMVRKSPTLRFTYVKNGTKGFRTTPEDSKNALLGAEFFLMLNVGDQPAGADQAEFQKTGLKWPKD